MGLAEIRCAVGRVKAEKSHTAVVGHRRECKIIGERLKGSGMRWVEDGAATVAALRALYVSGGKLWDGFWSQPHRAAA